MHFRITEWRLGVVLGEEAVAQSTRIPPGKGWCDGSFAERRVGQRGAVHGAAARLVGQQERGAQLGGDGADLPHAADVSAGHEPARRHHGNVDVGGDGCDEVLERLVGGRRGGVEGAAMPTSRRTLCDNAVDAHVGSQPRLGQRGHRAGGRDARCGQPPPFLDAGQTEGERHQRGPQIE